MDSRYKNVCKKLNELGYHKYCFKLDSLLLVEKLLGDLIETTDNLRKFKKIARETIEERDTLQFGAEPYKCANAKLVKECNELHLAFIHIKEQNDKQQKDLKKRISTLEKEKLEVLDIHKKQDKRIRELQLNAARKVDRALTFQFKQGHLQSQSSSALLKSHCPNKKRELEISSTMALAEQKIASLCRENSKLKDQLLELTEITESYKDKLLNREREIKRLAALLENGLPVRDCDSCNHRSSNNDSNLLQKIKNECDSQIKEARAKQHEAMKHALQLAERNNQLEKELREIDQMALQVEEECNSTVKSNANKVTRLDEHLQETVIKLQALQNDNNAIRRERKMLVADIETINSENRKIRDLFEKAIEENKLLTRKVSNFKIIEHDLNLEIDRLVNQTTNEKRNSADLRGQLLTGSKRLSNPDDTAKIMKDMLEKEMFNRFPDKTNSIERIRNERDFYIKEHQTLMQQFRNTLPNSDPNDAHIKQLENEIKTLTQEKYDLITKLEHMRQFPEDNNSLTMQTSLKRLERERELTKTDLNRLEDEKDTLKFKLKTSSDKHALEIEKHQQLLNEHAEKIRKLEHERNDLMQSHGTGSVKINQLQDDYDLIKADLKRTKDELIQTKTSYSQLKALHEQTDKTLTVSRKQLSDVERESREYLSQKDLIDNDKVALLQKIDDLKSDLKIMKKNLTEMEHEKDNLLIAVDTKTERIAYLDEQMRILQGKFADLDYTNQDLTQKISIVMDKSNSKDANLRSSQTDGKRMQQELQDSLRLNELALQENRRIQSDLTACTTDYRRCTNDLEIAKRQIDDLKRQLQHYVAEVRRIEDLVSQKEIERSDMLDQFKNLSNEAIVLVSNKNSLEHETTQTKVQLSVALDHSVDLEKQLDEQNTLIRNYEKEISAMSQQIAKFEMQSNLHDRTESDLTAIQDLCVSLDKQKDALMKELDESKREKTEINRKLDRLQRDREQLEKSQEKGINSVENLEALLSESRQETVEHRLINQDLQSEIMRLKDKVEDLQNKIVLTSKQLDVYQEKAVEYSHENKQLRREIINERFLSSKDDDLSSSSKSSKISSLFSSELSNEIQPIQQTVPVPRVIRAIPAEVPTAKLQINVPSVTLSTYADYKRNLLKSAPKGVSSIIDEIRSKCDTLSSRESLIVQGDVQKSYKSVKKSDNDLKIPKLIYKTENKLIDPSKNKHIRISASKSLQKTLTRELSKLNASDKISKGMKSIIVSPQMYHITEKSANIKNLDKPGSTSKSMKINDDASNSCEDDDTHADEEITLSSEKNKKQKDEASYCSIPSRKSYHSNPSYNINLSFIKQLQTLSSPTSKND